MWSRHCLLNQLLELISTVWNSEVVTGKGEGKVLPRTDHEGPEGKQMCSSTFPSTSALDGGGWSTPRPGRFTPRERPGTHCIGGWVGPRADLDRCGKSCPPPGFDPRTVQPVASRYTDTSHCTFNMHSNPTEEKFFVQTILVTIVSVFYNLITIMILKKIRSLSYSADTAFRGTVNGRIFFR